MNKIKTLLDDWKNKQCRSYVMKYIMKNMWWMVFLSLIATAINTNLLPSQIPYNFEFRTSDLSGADNPNNLPQ